MKKTDISQIFNQFTIEKDFSSIDFVNKFKKILTDEFDKQYSEKSVLGIDIYKYSKMDIVGQTVIPYILSEIYKQTIEACIAKESLFFNDKTHEWFKKNYIDTGDGLFQIFDTPLQSLIFAIHFQAITRVFNTGSFLPLLSMALNAPLTTRYAITTDSVMEYENRFYGPVIINNARIISCDTLNRFLIDNSTFEWFMINTNGIETLQNLVISDFYLIDDKLYPKNGNSLIIKKEDTNKTIIRIDIQQIDTIDEKKDSYKIFSLHMQISLQKTLKGVLNKLVISIGNLNTSGLMKEI